VPELPEIEHLKRTLEPVLRGAFVSQVQLYRPDVLRTRSPGLNGRLGASAHALLRGGRIAHLARHGKELAIIADDGRVLCVHLGMSGQLRFLPPRSRLPRRDHVHCEWRVQSRLGGGRLVFRDPRRFGGLWGFASREALRAARWDRLGPDALTAGAAIVHAALARTRRPVKAALLDQRLVAGIGNIYADEALFAAGVHPSLLACRLDASTCRRLAAAIRSVLRRAIRWGGSTIRDYVDGRGSSGSFAARHRVYGRASLPCVRCSTTLLGHRLAERTTVFSPTCQGMPPLGG
jgi:formamidopyrimidine-DNA glycosylase